MDIKKAHYALQMCDVKSYQNLKRYASDDRTEISKKCIKSFLESIKHCCVTHPHINHTIAIVDDHSSADLIKFVKKCILKYTSPSIQLHLIPLTDVTGIKESIKFCYQWLRDNGKDYVYQVQDDYLFSAKSIADMIDVYDQVFNETGSQCLVTSWNDSWLWLTLYRNIPTRRTVIVGKHGYWIQYYDMSCSFLTSHQQFNQHWDLYEMFLYMVDKVKAGNSDLENKSLNYILTQRGVLGLAPVSNISFHLGSDIEKDPHIDYMPLWDSIDIT